MGPKNDEGNFQVVGLCPLIGLDRVQVVCGEQHIGWGGGRTVGKDNDEGKFEVSTECAGWLMSSNWRGQRLWIIGLPSPRAPSRARGWVVKAIAHVYSCILEETRNYNYCTTKSTATLVWFSTPAPEPPLQIMHMQFWCVIVRQFPFTLTIHAIAKLSVINSETKLWNA